MMPMLSGSLWKSALLDQGPTVLLYLAAGFVLITLIRVLGRRLIERAGAREAAAAGNNRQIQTLVAVLGKAIEIAVAMIMLLLCLDALGVNIGPLMGAFAVFGLAFSFGAQSLVKDLVTGFFILLEGQVAVGDRLRIGALGGTVEKITLRRIVLRDQDGAVHHIPYSQVATLTNLTHRWSRVVAQISVGYEAELRETMRLIDAMGQTMASEEAWREKIIEAPQVSAIASLGDNAINLRIWCKVAPNAQAEVERELYLRLKETCDRHGIARPLSQRVVE